MSNEDYVREAIRIHLIRTVQFNKRYKSKGLQAKFTEWRPYRFASEDMVFGRVVTRFSRDYNCIEVDVCLTDDLPRYEDHNGAKAMCAFLFSEAFQSGGQMAIRFTKNVEGGRVPQSIVDYANYIGVELKFVDNGYITPYEARHLYLRLIGFSEQAMVKILQLALANKISTERICYMVCADIYSKLEMEMILLAGTYPEALLLGSTSPMIRNLYLVDLDMVRAAMMVTYLDIKLRRIDLEDEKTGLPIEVEDIESDLIWQVYSSYFAISYTSREEEFDVSLPWTDSIIKLYPDDNIIVLPRPRSMDAIMFHYLQDIESAELALASSEKPMKACCLLYPRDFNYLLDSDQEKIREMAKRKQVHILTCPESLLVIDRAAATRLERSKGVRQ